MRKVDTIIERWENVLRVLTSMSLHERRHHFDMASWGRKNYCGTIACAAGHASLDPYFRRRGFIGVFEPEYQTLEHKKYGGQWDLAITDFFIGPTDPQLETEEERTLRYLAQWMTNIFYCDHGTGFGQVTRAIRKGLSKLRRFKAGTLKPEEVVCHDED